MIFARILSYCLVGSTSLLAAYMTLSVAIAQSSDKPASGPTFSSSATFAEQTGDALYSNVCQACHMEDGKGAVGAGSYPPLANNSKLEASGYPLHIVLHGLNAMPPIGTSMSDEQVAAVVNYVRTHFGNIYADPVSPQDVSADR